MENPVLIKWEGNWADEMTVLGFVIMPKQKADSYKQYLEDREEEFTLSAGSNQDIKYYSGEELLEELEFSNLTNDEFEVFKKHFNGSDTFVYYGIPYFADVQAL